MVALLEGGAYLLHGTEIIPDSPEAEAQIKAKTGKEISKEPVSYTHLVFPFIHFTYPPCFKP